MNYVVLYQKIIDRAKNRTIEGYREKHHIIPRCMGGSDDVENLVDLTPEEHYVVHQLLVKIYPNEPKLSYAAHMMCRGRSNKLYGWLKRRHAYHIAKIDRSGSNNSQHGTLWITDGFESKKINTVDIIPEGWYKGRTCNSLKGQKRSEETIQKIKESCKDRPKYVGGHKLTEETKKRMSLSKMGNQNARKNKISKG